MANNHPNDYLHIRVWHESTGSAPYYWKNLQERAAEENAPLDSCYRDPSTGLWHTLEGTSDYTRQRLTSLVNALRGK